MNYTISIDRVMYWRSSSWIRYEQNPISLIRIHCDQLIICSGSKIFETLNMNGKIKGFFKDDVLILVVGNGQEIRKIKFRVKSDISECLRLLGQHFPIVSYDALRSVISSRYRNIEEVLKQASETMERRDSNIEIPPNFPNFVKLCLLDPSFPQIVQETQNVIEKL